MWTERYIKALKAALGGVNSTPKGNFREVTGGVEK